MRKFYSLLAIISLLFVTSCSVLEHDEKGMVFIQLSGDAILAHLNAQHLSRGGDLKPSVKYKAELDVTGSGVNMSFSQKVEEKKTLSFTVPNLPLNTSVTATVKITGDDNVTYYSGSANALIVDEVVPLEIALKYVGPKDDEPEATVESVEFVTKSESITEEFTFVYEAKATLSDGTIVTSGFTFASSDESILKIDDTGKATAVKPGNATITVSYEDKSASIDVEVKAKPIVVSCVSVEFTDKAIELAEGAENIFAARAVMSDGTYVTTGIKYSSSDTSVITINSSTGATVAKKFGTATITASYEDFKVEVNVTVLPSVVSVEFTAKAIELVEDAESVYAAKATLSDGTFVTTGLTFTSSDESIITIDSTGKAKALKPGNATIKVAYEDKSASVEVEVKAKTVEPEVTLESVEFVSKSESITEDFTFVYEAKATYSDGTIVTTGFTFASSDESIITIDSTGKAKAVKPGNATIKVSYKGKSASIDVEVKAKPLVVSCVGVEFTDKAIELAEGAENVFAARAVMSDSTYVTTGIKYSSSDTSVITINSSTGATVAKKFGTATITASYEDFKVEVNVTVLPSVVSVEFTAEVTELVEESESVFAAKATYSDGTSVTTGLTFTSSDESIITIDSTGKATAIKPGNVTVTVSYKGKSASVEVEVTAAVILESVEFVSKSESITEELNFVYEAKATFSDGTFKTTGFTFTSSDESILTIDDTGKATAIKPGNVTVTVSYKGKSASIDVEVKAKPVVVSCVGVEFTDKAIELAEGAENVFAARAIMSDGTYVTTGISYESSDDSVIAINSATGATVAKKYGTVTITASYEEFKAEVIVTVLPSIVKVEFVEKLETIVEGETKESAFTAKAILSDDSEITEGLIFTSSDPDVLAIDEDGNVTAGVPGTATITVSYKGVKDTFDITVLKLNSQGIGVDVTTFKLVATIDMESVYVSGDQIAVSGTDEIKFFCFNSTAGEYNYETDRISVDEWIWTLNGEQIDSGVSDINPQYISLKTENLNYAGKNIVQCTARKGEHWYEAVFLFTIKQDESTKLAANPIYYDSLTEDSGSLLWLDADSGRSIAITDTPAKNKPVYISTLSDGTTCIVFTGDYKAEDKTKLRCYKLDADGKPVCIKNGSDYFNANLKNPKWFEVDPSSGTSAIGKFAEDPYTGKIWFLGYNYEKDRYYFVGTESITETKDVKEIEFTVGDSGLELSYYEKYAYAVCNNYILISHNNMKYDVFHIEDDDTISWKGFTSFNPTGNSSARIVDMQTVKQGDSCYVYTVITASNGDPSYPNSTDIFNEYGCVSRIKYIPTESGIKAFDEETEYAAGLSANTKTERKVYYSRLQYNKYYGPTEEESNSCFYNPVRILAVREDAIFVEDDGFYQKEDSEPGTLTNKDRIMKISLQDKTVSVVKDDITVSLPSSAPSWKYEY